MYNQIQHRDDQSYAWPWKFVDLVPKNVKWLLTLINEVWVEYEGVKTCFHPLRFVWSVEIHFFSVNFRCMAELLSKQERKNRNSSGSEAVSPDGKRICEVSNKEIESSADRNGKNFTSASTNT